MSQQEQRLRNLQEANQRKAADARIAVDTALRLLVRDGQRVNINAISRKSGVSRGFIYEHPDIREAIESVAEQSKASMRRLTSAPNEASLTQRLSTALDTIAELKSDKRILQAENRRLEDRIENLMAQVFDLSTR